MTANQATNAAHKFMWTHDYLTKLISTGKNPIVTDPIIINAFRAIDRAEFVPNEQKNLTYQDKRVDIGYSEVMTNPVTVAKQIQALAPHVGGKYLHLGTGTGYVAALLGFIVGEKGQVFSVERIQWLWRQARQNIQKYEQLRRQTVILYRDGLIGLPDKAPFDGILISFALKQMPRQLVDQLNPQGKLVYPGTDYNLYVITKTDSNDVETEVVPGVAFDEAKEGIG